MPDHPTDGTGSTPEAPHSGSAGSSPDRPTEILPAQTRPTRTGPPQVTPDAWAWTEDEHQEPAPETSAIAVTAVLVAHNAEAWLGPALQSLRNLTRRPDQLYAVDTGSDDRTAQLLRESGLFDEVIAGRGEDGFGVAVNRALAVAEERPGEWLWLLHDDLTLAPDTLEQLLRGTLADPGADLLGPKLLQPHRGTGPARLSEVGVTISDSGRRELDLEPGEIDQGQHTARQVLAVSTCAMLVRRSVYAALGGLAPELPVFRDGVDLGWRATAAGHRVRTCPEAVVTHRQAGRNGLRRSALIGSDPTATDRQLALRTVAAHRGGGFASLRLILGSLLLSVGYLLAKAPAQARAEFAALRDFVGNGRTRALRARIAPPVSAEASATVAMLRPRRWAGLRLAAEGALGLLPRRDAPGTSIDELTGDDFASAGEENRGGFWSNPAAVTTLLLTVTALFAGRALIGPGSPASDLLLPARSSLGEAYRAYLAPIVGAPGLSAPPWLGLTALFSTVTAGRPVLLVALGFLLVVPVAALAAQPLLRRTVTDARVRIAATVLYALLAVLLAAVNRGLIAPLVLAVFLPLLAVSVRALVLRRTTGPDSWRPVWASGLLLSVLIAFLPALGLLALLGGLVAALLARREPARLLRIGVVALIPLILLAPWWPAVVNGWSRLLVGPDAGLGGQAVGPTWRLLLGLTPGPGAPALWLAAVFFGAIWLWALVGLALRTSSPAVWAALGTGLAALALAVLLSRQLATTLPQGTRVRPEVVSLLLLGFAALVYAGALGLDLVPAALAKRSLGLAHLATGLLVVVTVAAVTVGAAWWALVGAHGPIHREPGTVVAPYLRNAMNSPARTRVLAIEVQGPVQSWSLLADDQLRLGDADRGLAFGGSPTMQERTRGIVARLVSGSGDERVAQDLADLAVGQVWVSGANEELKSRINNTPGLGAASGDESVTVWSVPQTRGRWTVTGAQPIVLDARGTAAEATLPAATGPRQLVLSEPTDPRWRVTFNGNELTGRSAADRTTFDIPGNPGQLEVRLSDPLRGWLALAQLLGLLALVVLAAPSLAGSRQRRLERLGAEETASVATRVGGRRSAERTAEPEEGQR
ncbi:glycosyltransferase [Naumannella sp. ID2617S]|nr:glycosyltransferase [Naumannella sp. ID2617S]